MKSRLVAALALILGLLPSRAEYRTLEILGRRRLDPASARIGVIPARRPIYVLREDGSPLLSPAGYVQLAAEGPGFYYGALVSDQVEWNRSIGLVGTNNWGAVEALGAIAEVVEVWRIRHPDVRLGIDEISSRLGGFPDYDHDGISDHLTHQAGMNVNLFLPCRKQPEVTIKVGGGRNEELFDPALFGELIDLLVAKGAVSLTTNAGLGLLADPERARVWQEVARTADGYSVSYLHANGQSRLYLLTPPGDHGDHVNALMCSRW